VRDPGADCGPAALRRSSGSTVTPGSRAESGDSVGRFSLGRALLPEPGDGSGGARALTSRAPSSELSALVSVTSFSSSPLSSAGLTGTDDIFKSSRARAREGPAAKADGPELSALMADLEMRWPLGEAAGLAAVPVDPSEARRRRPGPQTSASSWYLAGRILEL